MKGVLIFFLFTSFLLHKVESPTFRSTVLYFQIGSAAIDSAETKKLSQLIELLKSSPEIVIEISGHSDCMEEAGAIKKLSEHRALMTKKYITDSGIDSARLQCNFWGSTRPSNRCNCAGDSIQCSDDDYAANRRVEFLLRK